MKYKQEVIGCVVSQEGVLIGWRNQMSDDGCTKTPNHYTIQQTGDTCKSDQTRYTPRMTQGFTDIFHFAESCDAKILNKRMLENLVRSGAFDSIHPNRKQLFQSIETIARHSQLTHEEKNSSQVSLFGGGDAEEIPKPQLANVTDWEKTEKLQNEFNAVGFYLTAHPLSSYKKLIGHLHPTYSNEFAKKLRQEKQEIRVVGIVVGKKFKISQKGRFGFIQLSDAEGSFEIAVYNEQLISDTREIIENGRKIYAICDARKEGEGKYRIIANSIRPLEDELKKNVSIDIKIESEEQLSTLKTKLDALETGNGRITITVPVEDKTVHIRLKKRYLITPDIIADA